MYILFIHKDFFFPFKDQDKHTENFKKYYKPHRDCMGTDYGKGEITDFT